MTPRAGPALAAGKEPPREKGRLDAAVILISSCEPPACQTDVLKAYRPRRCVTARYRPSLQTCRRRGTGRPPLQFCGMPAGRLAAATALLNARARYLNAVKVPASSWRPFSKQGTSREDSVRLRPWHAVPFSCNRFGRASQACSRSVSRTNC